MKYRGKSYHAWLLSSAAATAIMWAGSAAAEDAQFNIAPQPLASALNEFSVQSKQSVLFTTELAQSKASRGVSGQVEVADALSSLLAGTGLTYRRTGNTFLIVDASDPQSGSAAGDGAEGTVQALVVTAQKREESIQDVPIAMSAFTQEDLTRSQVAGGPDLMTQVPNFTFTKTNFSGYSIQIRGIGTQAISATTDPAVAVAFNNTPFIRNRFFEQEFYDLERVEVLRGPQGTLYGRNATAGVVNMISAKPKFHYEARLSADLGNYNSTRLEGMTNIPLVEDKAALRIAGAWTKREGYVKNTLAGQQTDGRDLWSGRLSLGLEPVDWLHVNLIWEHFEENDDRLRSGKQLCHSDPGPSVINGDYVVPQAPADISGTTAGYVSQGCRPASLYSPDSFETPNGLALGYYGPLALVGSPTYYRLNPYSSTLQSRNLREIETHIEPEYDARNDIGELQFTADLPHNLTFASETGFNQDHIFSFEDYNRFDTTPGVFVPGAARLNDPSEFTTPGPRLDIVDANGYFCDPQLGCTNRLAAGDLSTAKSRQFSQEFRLSSDFTGVFNFSLGANFLRYDTEEKYYVFINTLTAYEATWTTVWQPGVSDNSQCLTSDFNGYRIADPTQYYSGIGCAYIDPNDIHHLNDQGRNYFLSKNPYHLRSYGMFGEAYYNIADNLKLTLGFRWNIDKKRAPVIPTWLLAGSNRVDDSLGSSYGLPTYKVIKQVWREPTGRVALDWKPDLSFTDETLVYGSYVRGYKAGGVNPPPPVLVLATQCPPECNDFGDQTTDRLTQHYLTHPERFDPEFVNAYEIGTKNTLFEGRLTANLSAFYYDYAGYQISEIVDRSALNFNFDADVWGGELELDWRPVENFRLGFKGGYEDTRVADGMKAIDLMDRTAGKPGWMVYRPFPTMPSNCVIPTSLIFPDMGPTGFQNPIGSAVCAAYLLNYDPITFLPYVPNPTEMGLTGWPMPPGYPGYDPASANNGQGFEKDLSGNQLPNAPKVTATITADYTIPMANDWLATLHTDLYYQSEAWTRIFNDPGYDKLKAYTNVNLAAIFSNEAAGWKVMAYVKNVFDKDNVTGAFLNSDDTGLTTNVFLNEPRLYGLRVTKNWTGDSGWFAGRHAPGAPYPFTFEVGGQAVRTDAPGRPIMPYADKFSGNLDPTRPQVEDLDWTDSPDFRLTYRPEGSPWKIEGGMRYGRISNQSGKRGYQETVGDAVCSKPTGHYYNPTFPDFDLGFAGKLSCDPEYAGVTKDVPIFGEKYFANKYDPSYLLRATDRLSDSTDRKEDHLIVDFEVGKDVGLGRVLGVDESSLGVGLRYADFTSDVSGYMRGIPDMTLPQDGWSKYNTTFHQYIASFDAKREFKGLGPTLSWEASRPLLGSSDAGHLNVDWRVTGGALFGRQTAKISGMAGSQYFNAVYPSYPSQYADSRLAPPTQAPLNIAPRTKSVVVPLLDLSLGLSWQVPGVTLGAGYRWERYFNVLDAGFTEREAYDRTIDGPYFKIAVGLGG
jgi:outer membrane receptor protein involved in Fe transport